MTVFSLKVLNIFVIRDLKSFSENSNIYVILELFFIDCFFSWQRSFFPFLLYFFFFSANFCVLESMDITLQRLWILLYSFEEYSSSHLSWLNSNSKRCLICDEHQWKSPLWTLVFYWFSWSSPCIRKSGLSWESRQVRYLDSELSICTSSFLWFLPSFPSTLATPHFVLWPLRPVVLDFLLETQSRHSTQLGMCPQ